MRLRYTSLPSRPGRYVSVGGRRLHVVEMGRGTPVIFEAGAGGWSSHWGSVPERTSERIRAIAYDRAGLGWSDPAPGSRDAPALARDMLELLDALGIQEPAILVAHSFGASIARIAATEAPGRFGGIIFVDGWHESFGDWERDRKIPGPPAWMMTVHLVLARLGILRILGALLPAAPPPWPIRKDLWESISDLSMTGRHVHAAWREYRAFPEGDAALLRTGKLGMPIHALVARETLTAAEAPKGYPVEAHNEAWRKASERLGSLSEWGTTEIIPGTDHHIALNIPEIVSAAIFQMDASLHANRRKG